MQVTSSVNAAHSLSYRTEKIFDLVELEHFCILFWQTLLVCFFCLCDVFFPEAVVNDISGENKAGTADVSASQHVMVCALKELGSLVQSLSATASPLIQEPSIGESRKMLNGTVMSVL